MRTIYSGQYNCACIAIEDGDTAEDVIERCQIDGAIFNEPVDESTTEETYCIQFPTRGFPELYSENALRRSLPVALGF